MMRQRAIPFAKVVCDGNEMKYIRQVLESGWLTTAGKTQEFERSFSEAVAAPYACAVNSCTAALHLALDALGVKPGDTVLVPTMTFTATAEVVRYLGADPVFLDMEYGSCLLTPGIVQDALDRYSNARVLMLVHYGGQAAELISGDGNGILDICRRQNVKVVEDAAHAFPARIKGKTIGAIGDVACFSFYANKTITSGEGGMLTTHNEKVARRVRCMRLHGIDRDVWNRFTSEKPSWEYDVIAAGYKYNMPDTAAAIGLAQLERAHVMRSQRERCARYYFKHLTGVTCIDLPLLHVDMADHAWHLFHIVLKEDAPVSRNRFIEEMAGAGIGTSVHYKPMHRMTYYRERYNLRPEDYPNAERMWKGCVSLPIYPALTEDDLAYICETVKRILDRCW